MNNKALTLSIVMAVFAVMFMQSYVGSIEEEAKKKFGTEVLVLKAKRDIKEQETITETSMELVPMPKNYLEPSAVSFDKKEEDKDTDKRRKELTGSVALVPIKKGEQITYNKITEPSIRTGLASQIAPGKRAVAIPIDEKTGVSKLIKPGDRVDLIAVLDLGGGKENKISKTFLQDVVVLSTGKNVTNHVARVVEVDPFGGKEKVRPLTEDTTFSTVTLEVDPIQAQLLSLVMSNSDNAISLALRNNDDSDRPVVGAATFTDILGADAAKAQRRPAGK